MSKTLVIAHRGANKYAPQNTLAAFKKAYEIGCDGFETDVHITKDGKIVICHNYTIDETSTGKGEISQMTLAELKSYDFGSYFSKKFEGTEIPTIDEFLSFVETTDISVLNIEIKSPKENETAIVKETLKAVKDHGLFPKLLISSFDPKLLLEAKALDKNCKTGFLFSPTSKAYKKVFYKTIDFAKEINCDAIHPMYLQINEKYIQNAHAKGLMVNPWTVNSPKAIDKLLVFGADAIITDLPDVVGGMRERYL
ncbi:MAG: glycerophosphodiester phosphodiesterase [Acutalibacteraceae bacterium]